MAVVGLGVGEQHAWAYYNHAACQVRKLYDLDQSKSRALAEKLNEAISIAADYRDLISDPSIDIISIASFDDSHFDQIMAALNAGKHVFVEKPLCRTSHEVDQIREAWTAAGKPALGVNLVLREAPLYRWLKEAIVSGTFGRVYAIDGDYLYGRLEKITEGWRKDVPDYSVMQGGGVHMVDLMLWLTGETPQKVYAIGNRICSEGTAFKYEDFASATFEFDSGMVGRVTANFGCVHRHQHVLRVFGTEATFIYDDSGARLHRTREPDGKVEKLLYPPKPEHKGVLIPGFIERVVDTSLREQEAKREFDLMLTCLAADRSLKEKKPVALGVE